MNLSIEDFVRVERADTPHFSPDGKRLVYRWNRSGSPQAYVLDLESGESRQLTATDGVVYSVRRRPHSTEALFVTDDGGDEQYQLQLVDSRDGSARVLTSEPNVICNFGAFSHDGTRISYGSNRRDRRYFDVYVQDVESGEGRYSSTPPIKIGRLAALIRSMVSVTASFNFRGSDFETSNVPSHSMMCLGTEMGRSTRSR